MPPPAAAAPVHPPRGHQQLGEPLRVLAFVQPSDQRGAVGVGAREHVQQLAGSGLADGCGNTSRDGIVFNPCF
jgi:hypothetical protein